MASNRVDVSLRKRPRTAEVTVDVPDFFTPRMDMQRCSASTTTSTPFGSRASSMASAICDVIRSWTWSRLAKPSTSRASFDRPVIRPSGPGMYATCARPMNGTMWCSHSDAKGMSRTITISS